jgi:hypothetical protein
VNTLREEKNQREDAKQTESCAGGKVHDLLCASVSLWFIFIIETPRHRVFKHGD